MTDQNQSLSVQSKPRNALALSENKEAQSRLDSFLLGCFTVQKLYGREPESLDVLNRVFHSILGNYPGEKVVRAFETWMERSQEFPTPADIVGLIRRKGKPPLAESEFIRISKKDGEDRSPEEWQYMRDWQEYQQGGWNDEPDEIKTTATIQDNARLRSRVAELETAVARMTSVLHQERMKSGQELPERTEQDSIRNTVNGMRAMGASEEAIREFLIPYGITDIVAFELAA